MLYEFNVYQMSVEKHTFWVAESKGLKGCVGQGDTSEEAIKELEENETEWIATAKECDIPIPTPTFRNSNLPSGKISLRVSPTIHQESLELVDRLNVSLNSFLHTAIVSYIEKVKSEINIPVSNNWRSTSESKVVNFPSSAPEMPIKVSVGIEREEM